MLDSYTIWCSIDGRNTVGWESFFSQLEFLLEPHSACLFSLGAVYDLFLLFCAPLAFIHWVLVFDDLHVVLVCDIGWIALGSFKICPLYCWLNGMGLLLFQDLRNFVKMKATKYLNPKSARPFQIIWVFKSAHIVFLEMPNEGSISLFCYNINGVV